MKDSTYNFYRWELPPWLRNVRTHARMCTDKQAQNLLCTIQTFGASNTTKSTNQTFSEHRMNEYGYR
jgi:hypothetical protein